MKEEDKLLLLIELVDGNVKEFLKEKNKEFHNSETLLKIDDLIKKNHHSKSPKYLIAQREYEKIKEVKITSMETYFINIARAERILSSLLNKEFVNPLMCSKEEGNISLASLVVNFNGKNAYLGDIIMSDVYLDNRKIDLVKEYIITWRKEVDETFIRPLQLLLTYPKNLPKKRRLPLNKLFIGLFLIILNFLFAFSFFLKGNYIRPILKFDYTNYFISIPYFLLFALLCIFDFSYIFLLLKRNNEHIDYFYAQEKLLFNSKQIMDEVRNNTEHLYQKMLNCIIYKQELNGKASQYSISENKITALSYLQEENERPELDEDHISNYEIVLIELIVVLVVYFIALISLYQMGLIK